MQKNCFIVLLLFGLGLNLLFLNKFCFWADEAYSALYSSYSLQEMLTLAFQYDNHPPLYYVLLHFWEMLFQSTWGLRLFSVFASFFAIILFYQLGKRWQKGSLLLVSLFFFISSTFFHYYFQELRAYAWLVVTALLSLVLAFHFIDKGKLLSWILFILILTGHHLLHGSAFIWVFAFFVFTPQLGNPQKRGRVILLFIGILLSLLPFGYWYFFIPKHPNMDIYSGTWQRFYLKPGLGDILRTYFVFINGYLFRTITGPEFPYLKKGIMALSAIPSFLLAGALLRLFQTNEGRKKLFILGGLSLFPIIGAILISYLIVPVFSQRSFVFAALALFYLMGEGVIFWKEQKLFRWKGMKILGVILIGSYLGTCLYYSYNALSYVKSEYRDNLNYVSQNWEKNRSSVVVYYKNIGPVDISQWYLRDSLDIPSRLPQKAPLFYAPLKKGQGVPERVAVVGDLNKYKKIFVLIPDRFMNKTGTELSKVLEKDWLRPLLSPDNHKLLHFKQSHLWIIQNTDS